MNSALLAILFIFSLYSQALAAERITLQSGNGNELGTATNPVYVSGGGSGAPTDADYLVGTANGSLSAEIVVGATPGGELGGTWGTPTIDDSVAVTSWNLTTPTITTSLTTSTPTTISAAELDRLDGLAGTIVTTSAGTATLATALAANGANCSAGSAPLGVDASGVVETCTDYEEDLANSAGLAAAISDESGTGVVVFGTDASLSAPAISGTPNAVGEIGYDTTQKMNTYYGGATSSVGQIHRTLAAGVGTESVTNSGASDFDFTSPYTFPASSIYTNKVYRVTFYIESVMGTSTVTRIYYVKLGSTKVFTSLANDVTNSTTQNMAFSYMIIGRAAAGASADVSTNPVGSTLDGSQTNRTNQPVALATNGTLALTFGVTYSGSGSTETDQLLAYTIEELN